MNELTLNEIEFELDAETLEMVEKAGSEMELSISQFCELALRVFEPEKGGVVMNTVAREIAAELVNGDLLPDMLTRAVNAQFGQLTIAGVCALSRRWRRRSGVS